MDMENMLYTILLETVLFSYTQYSNCMVQMRLLLMSVKVYMLLFLNNLKALK